MSEPEHIDPSQLRPGPIRNESLPSKLLDQIKAVFDVIGQYLGMTLEEFEIGFMRDMHPESEVALWFRITKAWLATVPFPSRTSFHKSGPIASNRPRTTLVRRL